MIPTGFAAFAIILGEKGSKDAESPCRALAQPVAALATQGLDPFVSGVLRGKVLGERENDESSPIIF